MDSRRMCPHCRAFITTKDRVCPYCNESVGPRAIDRRDPSAILGFIPHARFNTVVILLVNFSLYIATTIYSMKMGNGSAISGLDMRTLFLFGAKEPQAILLLGQWWRLVTAGFLHGGMFHILMNSWVLFDVGAQVEELYGGARMWVIYFVSSVFGFYLSYLFVAAPSVGASAGLMGLVGSMIVIGMRHRSAAGAAIRGAYVRWVIYILIIGLLPGLHVDNAAHIGGLAGGFGIAWLAGQPRYEGSPAEKLWRVASWFCVILTIVSFLKWYLWFARVTQ